jgi:hypothetical protein
VNSREARQRGVHGCPAELNTTGSRSSQGNCTVPQSKAIGARIASAGFRIRANTPASLKGRAAPRTGARRLYRGGLAPLASHKSTRASSD